MQLCPSWGIPLKEGMPCIVFRRELEVACPELPEFLSQAGNQTHEVHSKETNTQLMLSLSQLVVSLKNLKPRGSAPSAASAPASWERVKKDMKSMKPHIPHDAIEEAAASAAAWGGDDDSSALLEVEAYAKQLKQRREPEVGQLALLAGAKVSKSPKWPIA